MDLAEITLKRLYKEHLIKYNIDSYLQKITGKLHKFTIMSQLTPDELSKIKEWFVRKLESLERDAYRAFTDKIEIHHSLGKGAAPFPITLYCMSILDFFSAAYMGYSEKGNDRSKLNQTQRMAEFLNKYMKYDVNISIDALDILRHKLVHLGEPHAQSKHSGKKLIGWQIASQEDSRDHWQIKEIDAKGNKAIYFGVGNFIKDLQNGVLGQNGYFVELSSDPDLQSKYRSFISEIM